MLEKAPREHRGGTSALTVHMLFAYEGVEDVKPLVGDVPPDVMRRMEERVTRYTKDMYYDNIMRVTEGKSDPELATILVERSTGHGAVDAGAGAPVGADVREPGLGERGLVGGRRARDVDAVVRRVRGGWGGRCCTTRRPSTCCRTGKGG